MRLEKLKIAGFKSFVDPTTIPLPGNLVGVVGPNGCGKSNVIDAVRWVMGESSARHLRGETMADVIFNGSSTRKPASLASVELVFDNSSGRAGGEYGKYQQIAIRRQIARDGQSSYFLNGTRCRRKDITDLFLGTGLGARSYAIIEQGTISRLIEAKPDEMREVIEEAAGISKYKERRHETEQRMRHTRENLERLADLREEVGRQLGHLQRQARKAEKFIALRDEERRLKLELLGLRWRALEQQLDRLKAELADSEERFRRLSGEEHACEGRLEELGQHRSAAQEKLDAQQGRLYELGAEISRLDQFIRHTQKSREELVLERERVAAELRKAESDRDEDRLRLEEMRAEGRELLEKLALLERQEMAAASARQTAEAKLNACRDRWETLTGDQHKLEGQVALQRSRLHQLREQEQQLGGRRQRLLQQQAELEKALAGLDVETLRMDAAGLEAEREEMLAATEELGRAAEGERGRLRASRQRLNEIRAGLHALQGKVASLETLQRHAMGRDRSALDEVLAAWRLSEADRLGERIEVSPGWETAVETVLGLHIEAVCVDDLAPYAENLQTRQPAESLAFCEYREGVAADGAGGGERLLDRVQSPLALEGLLGGVYCASDLVAAVGKARSLRPHESVVTPEGIRIGVGWMLVHKPDAGHAGTLARERELRECRRRADELRAQAEVLEAEAGRAETELERLEAARREARKKADEFSAQVSRLRAELAAAEARREQLGHRLAQLGHELDELADQGVELAEKRAEADAALSAAERDSLRLQDAAAQLMAERQVLEEAFAGAEAVEKSLHEEVRTLRSRAATLESNESLTRSHLQRLEQQHGQTADRLGAIVRKLEESEIPLEDERFRLEALMEERAALEAEMTRQRRRLAELESDIRRVSGERQRAEHELAALRDGVGQIKLAWQTAEVRRQGIEEQFAEFGAAPAAIVAALPESAEESVWQASVARLGEEIDRLGPVNLTAMQEYREQEERQRYLEEQERDLTESLATLEQAIEKIDRECRARFKETFEKIDTGFQRMFPKLFGGGKATLELTENNLLSTGVSVMAQPPGKRNSSIHLLSGGEKALTAVALVFSIFELNPAPFCLLDEVDAPLDDANVGRFSQLVKEMSEKVQFLFITHNKVTMEIAQYLAGVTMREPGVSRIVAVDIDAAVELASV
ncbi:chromosome segregation protein SMC [Methylococcus geothermalis]|uniref:Chromosome partition protein Smc n=1 Tax=Methylococcus geothermalis TaxID=2681310 RepID=A0A858Q6Q6_9GAMM|nr:chromosome segregation protein SMC [Methylococcus geothermalis]QJD29511.1 chromosome segregation protein SMC [Methylococcus geothermalis]